jgi:predicted DNA-binding ribbon-helix-helix protein
MTKHAIGLVRIITTEVIYRIWQTRIYVCGLFAGCLRVNQPFYHKLHYINLQMNLQTKKYSGTYAVLPANFANFAGCLRVSCTPYTAIQCVNSRKSSAAALPGCRCIASALDACLCLGAHRAPALRLPHASRPRTQRTSCLALQRA